MTDEADVDPAELEAQLDQIKEAMGIQERYEGATAQWLLFGVLVAVAAAISQVVYLRELPAYWHGIVWIGLLFGGGLVGFRVLFEGEDGPSFSSEGKPNLWLPFAASYATIFPIQTIAAAFLPDLGYRAETIFTLSLILVLIGLAYVLLGNALRAYYIRARDRYAFYAGGILLVALGTAIPSVEVLRTWGYAVFGAVYFVYAVVTYVVLTRT